jgi:hypothetical protein
MSTSPSDGEHGPVRVDTGPDLDTGHHDDAPLSEEAARHSAAVPDLAPEPPPDPRIIPEEERGTGVVVPDGMLDSGPPASADDVPDVRE